ncbi:MAG: carboxypeptidase-like regulatory domain-containing protein, partial [Singulisphaera sp.]
MRRSEILRRDVPDSRISFVFAAILFLGLVYASREVRTFADEPNEVAGDPPAAEAEAQLRKALGAGDDELVGITVELDGDKLKPVSDVTVLVWEQDEHKIRSDKNGFFHAKLDLADDADKHLMLRFVKPGYAKHLEHDWHVGHRNSPVAIMGRDTWIEGIVRRPDGQPAANVLVRANQGPKDNFRAFIPHIWVETCTDAAGRYKLLVDPDWYAMEIRAPGVGTARFPKPGEKPADPQPDNETVLDAAPKALVQQGEHRTVDIQLDRGVEFRAKLVDSVTVKPIVGARLWHWQYPGIEGHSDEQGMVKIDAMPAGEFTFMVEASGYVRGWSDAIPQRWRELAAESQMKMFPLDEGLPFDLAPEMQVITVRLEPGVTVSGRVLDPLGMPVAGATVAPARTGTGRSLTGDTRYSVTSQNDGTFVAILPPSGEKSYNLLVNDGEYGQWRKWANGIGAQFQTEAGQKIDNVELRLSQPGIIRGRVVDEQGNA